MQSEFPGVAEFSKADPDASFFLDLGFRWEKNVGPVRPRLRLNFLKKIDGHFWLIPRGLGQWVGPRGKWLL
jgi:hypothetical protein